MTKLTPTQLTQEFINGVSPSVALDFDRLRRMPDLPGRDIAKAQVGRKSEVLGSAGMSRPWL